MTSSPTAPNRFAGVGLIAILWLIVAAVMLYLFAADISALSFGDPDDALRMVQVRDLLAGQGWYDTLQYRIDPANGGGNIHWSRFIDVQIGALILLLEPLLGMAAAERWAAAIYPLLLLALLLWLMGRILGRLGNRNFVRCGLIVTATTVTYLHYFTPLRIDHHNWQMLLSLAMLWLALGPASHTRGLLAALVIALHLEISLEGLPYLVMFGGLYAWEWVRDPREAPRLRGFALGLALLAPLWVLLLRGPNGVLGVYCDAFSRPYLAGAAVTGLAVAALLQVPALQTSLWRRIGLLMIAGTAGGVAFIVAGPQCLNGPFGDLSPLVRTHWYEGIGEGHPIWTQSAMAVGVFGLPSLAGLAMLFWALRRAEIAPWAAQWRRLALVAAASFILSLMILRTTAVTHAYLVPAFALAALTFLRWARARPTALARIPASAATILLFPLSFAALGSLVMTMVAGDETGDMPGTCLTPEALAPLATLPATTLFTPLDVAPALLVSTPHSVIATGHHRNHRAIHQVLATFMDDPARAEASVRRSGATHLLICKNLADFQHVRDQARAGLAAALDRGAPPLWLEPVPELSRGPLLVFRVLPLKTE
jgi:hypothetical protein